MGRRCPPEEGGDAEAGWVGGCGVVEGESGSSFAEGGLCAFDGNTVDDGDGCSTAFGAGAVVVILVVGGEGFGVRGVECSVRFCNQ